MEQKFYSLSVISKRIAELLEPAIGKHFWVKAEVSTAKERGGNYYCDLIETNSQKKIIAKMSCIIWNSDFLKIKNSFKLKEIDFTISNGTVVAFLCYLQFSSQYGLSLRVIDADPSMILGEFELKKREIIKRLQNEGLFEINRNLFVPTLPTKIGLITSQESAAYNDFITTLQKSRFGFKIYFADAMMQGDQTEKSITKALDAIAKLNVDILFIVRGGGSKTDLHYLDNELIARKIAHYPIPVWTGIGHETDTSILDFVAHSHFKTPTAAAENLIARFVHMRRKIDESINSLNTVWNHRLKIDINYLKRAVIGIKQGSRKLIDVKKLLLKDKTQKIRLKIQNKMSLEKGKISIFTQKILSLPTVFVNKKIRMLAKFKFKFSSIVSYRLSIEKKILQDKIYKLSTKFQKNIYDDQNYIAKGKQKISTMPFAIIKTSSDRLLTKIQIFQFNINRNLLKKKDIIAKINNRLELSRFIRKILTEKDQIDYKKNLLKSIFTRSLRIQSIVFTNLKAQFKLEKILKRIDSQKSSLNHKKIVLKATNPESSLKRGFSICSTLDGKIIKSVNSIAKNQTIRTQLSDGFFISNAQTTEINYERNKSDL